MRHMKLTILPALLFILLAGLFVQSGTARAVSTKPAITCTGSWQVVSSPNTGSSLFYGVTSLSISDAWAVGSGTNSSFNAVPLAEHWNGTAWSIVSTPSPTSNPAFLYGAAAVTTGDVWAVGVYENSSLKKQPLIEQWNGTAWKIVTSPSVSGNGILYSVAALAANNVWAAGYSATSSGVYKTLIEHYTGKSWTIVASPNPAGQNAELYSISANGGKNIWAVGEKFNSSGITTTLTEHYTGTSWKIVSSPNVSNASYTVLESVTTISSSAAWAVGITGNSSGTNQTVTEWWNGTSWSLVSSPNATNQSHLYGVAAASTSNVWAVGFSYNGSTSQTLTEHWGGKSWAIVANAAPTNSTLQGIGRVFGTKNFWAVGFTITNNGSSDQTLTEYYC